MLLQLGLLGYRLLKRDLRKSDEFVLILFLIGLLVIQNVYRGPTSGCETGN